MSEIEPRDVGPRVGGDRAVSDDDRRLATELLAAAGADGRLRATEVTRRQGLAFQARTLDDLIPLTRDLLGSEPLPYAGASASYGNAPYGNSYGAAVSAPAASSRYLAGLPQPGPTADRDMLVAVFGASSRKGIWAAPAAVTSIVVFGGSDVNLTKAVWSSPEIELTVYAVFGGVDIKVPAGTEIVNQVVPVFGGVDLKGSLSGGNGRRVIVKGVCVFSEVSVKGI
ncbi:MAG: DUF1707 domain-containing protein [Propionibacteriaceae bacterium]|jgi:hypothetical protein|nr:DUF1707 domain-containing protein [Propionibacteriaceae bacterium]